LGRIYVQSKNVRVSFSEGGLESAIEHCPLISDSFLQKREISVFLGIYSFLHLLGIFPPTIAYSSNDLPESL